MAATLVHKTSVIWWMLVLSGMVISCSGPGFDPPSHLMSRGTISPLSESTTEELRDEVKVVFEQAIFEQELQAITALRRLFAELQSRAKQGDTQARDIVIAMLTVIQHRRSELQSDLEQGDPEAQHALRLMLLVISSEQVQTETWRCFKLFDRNKTTALFTLIRMRIGGEDVIGEVSIAGATHLANFQVAGLNLRWDFGSNEGRGAYRYAFVIEPDGTGAYYDFETSEDGRAKPRQIFECQLSL